MNGTGHSLFGMYLARCFVKRRRIDFLFSAADGFYTAHEGDFVLVKWRGILYNEVDDPACRQNPGSEFFK